MSEYNQKDLQHLIKICCKTYEEVSWLLNSYVLDFFTENHWRKLPNSWKKFLAEIQPEDMGNVININEQVHCKHVLPLSLLALRTLVQKFHLPRKQQSINEPNSLPDGVTGLIFVNDILSKLKIRKLFWKHVKPKKRHEIELIAKMCYHTALESKCFCIVDVGSGLGHLSRLLSFGYGFKVCGFERQEKLTEQARKLDEEFERTARKYYSGFLAETARPVHVNMKIKDTSDISKIIQVFKESFGLDETDVYFGIVGLHPCGNLGANLLRFFNVCPNIRFINIVSCCYMKLTTPDSDSDDLPGGYPLSNFCLHNNYILSYYSREIACHALEGYVNRLKAGQYWQLKIHSYRATIEKLITRRWPNLKHSPLNNVKYTEKLTFSEYCGRALLKKNLKIDVNDGEIEEIQDSLRQWKKVVMFYSLRLLMAPMIESIILLDRLLFTIENGAKATIIPVFDPLVSPRNHVLTALKMQTLK